MLKKVLITGISGMLGTAVYNYFKDIKVFEIFGISRQKDFYLDKAQIILGDLNNGDTYKKINSINFDYVIYCAAEINVNFCEENKDYAYAVNVSALKSLHNNLYFKTIFYISTDAIYNGIDGDFTELNLPDPINYYAYTKLEGEKIIDLTKGYVLRTNIYGFSTPQKKSLFEWAIKELNDGNKITGYTNVFFNPLYINQVALLIDLIIQREIPKGIYNLGANEVISKYEFLVKIANYWDYDQNLISPVLFDSQNAIVKRGVNTSLNINKIKTNLPNFNFSFEAGFDNLFKTYNKI